MKYIYQTEIDGQYNRVGEVSTESIATGFDTLFEFLAWRPDIKTLRWTTDEGVTHILTRKSITEYTESEENCTGCMGPCGVCKEEQANGKSKAVASDPA